MEQPRVAITGASGLIGSRLAPHLIQHSYAVHPLVRRAPRSSSREIRWDPGTGVVDPQALDGVDAVVHLAGKSIAAGRWTPAMKREIRDSRSRPTRQLCEALARLPHPPRVLVSASAIGYYGHRGDELLTEQSPPGTDFLAGVCQEWEEATAPAAAAGIRVAHLRIGVVLATGGGALGKVLPLFRAGLGGPLGSGKQWWSWISLTDLVRAVQFLIETEVDGPFNGTAPHPVTNAEWTRALAAELHRPAILPAPAFALRVVLGELADALALTSARVQPVRLLEAGFQFQHPHLPEALRDGLVK